MPVDMRQKITFTIPRYGIPRHAPARSSSTDDECGPSYVAAMPNFRSLTESGDEYQALRNTSISDASTCVDPDEYLCPSVEKSGKTQFSRNASWSDINEQFRIDLNDDTTKAVSAPRTNALGEAAAHATARTEDKLIRSEKDIAMRDLPPDCPETEMAQPYFQQDGGLVAWLQVVTGILLGINEGGYASAYGAWAAHYTVDLGLPAIKLAWVGTVQVFITTVISTFSGRATDAGYYRHVTIAGLALQMLSIVATSLSTKYWHLMLSQGVCFGIGTAILLTPAISLVSTYFERRKTLAILMVSCGPIMGGAAYPALVRKVLPELGYEWTVRIMGFIVLYNGTLAIALARPQRVLRRPYSIFKASSMREMWYSSIGMGMVFALLGQRLGYAYLRRLQVVIGFGVDFHSRRSQQ